MWDCGGCGCQAIAADLAACPMCGKEREMPKATTGGASNAAAGAEPDESLPPPPPASAPKAEHVDYAVNTLGVPPEEAESMTKADLTAAAQTAAEPPAPEETSSKPAPAPAPKQTTTE